MTTNKKNQHYIPKFYLKNFSYQNNKKEIGIFNTKSQFYVKAGPLKNQGSKDFFYGKDGVIEDWLSEAERKLAACISNILDTKKSPSKNSIDHIDLVAFIAIMELRNPISIESIKERNEMMKASLLEIDPLVDTSKVVPDLTHEESVEIALSEVLLIMKICGDLEYKLLINQTSIPYITSDVPVVKYNQFLERKKWRFGKTGFGNVGLQIIIPLSPTITALFYDSKIYNVGKSGSSYMNISNEDDIDQLNLLQLLNCKNNVFFNDEISNEYLNELFDISLDFNKANKTFSNVQNIYEKDNEGTQLMRMSSTDCEIDLNIRGIVLNSGAGRLKFSGAISELRPHAKRVRELDED